jgi:hypothetical protein
MRCCSARQAGSVGTGLPPRTLNFMVGVQVAARMLPVSLEGCLDEPVRGFVHMVTTRNRDDGTVSDGHRRLLGRVRIDRRSGPAGNEVRGSRDLIKLIPETWVGLVDLIEVDHVRTPSAAPAPDGSPSAPWPASAKSPLSAGRVRVTGTGSPSEYGRPVPSPTAGCGGRRAARGSA